MKRLPPSEGGDLGFQIAPLLDVIFVILLYFMVMAGSVKLGYEIKTTLPGSAEASENAESEPPEEVTIAINQMGEVSINDEPIAAAEDTELNNLYVEMKRLAEAASQSQLKIIVTVAADETVKYDCIMNVLDILAKAKVLNDTFSATEGEDF